MDKESLFEKQKLDCNCNDCFFMQRDFETYNKWKAWHKQLQLEEFELKKRKEQNPQIKKKMQFQFKDTNKINYGFCNKKNIPVSFIPNTCLYPINKSCFVHRKNISI